MGLLFSAVMLGIVSIFAPDLGASSLAAKPVHRLNDCKSATPPGDPDPDAVRNFATSVTRNVAAKKIYFE